MTAEKTNVINRLCSAITSLVTTHNSDSTAHNDIRTNLDNKIDKSVTSGFVKNDGTIDTNTYLKDITVISDEENIANNGIYILTDPKKLQIVYTDSTVTLGTEANWLIFSDDSTIGTIDWGDGSSTNIDTSTDINVTHTYTDNIDTHTITIKNPKKTGNNYLFAYSNRQHIAQIDIPDSMIELGQNSLYGCSMPSINIPDSITTISSGCFWYCSELTSINIPNSITTLSPNCFSSCSKLASVIIPNSITTIGSKCFSDCSSLASITIPNSITVIDDNAFSFSGLTSINIPESVTTLNYGCFQYCRSLESISIPSSVTAMNGAIFNGITNLNCQLYWTDDDIVGYSAVVNGRNIPNFKDTATFTIPQGQTNNYIAKGYPADKLTERDD